MNEFIVRLSVNPLFEGISDHDIAGILTCMCAYVARYGKGDIMIGENVSNDSIGIILSGSAEATNLDLSGKRFVLAHHSVGSIFGDILAVSAKRKSPVSVTASEPVTALRIPAENILNRCQKLCERHNTLTRNLLNIISDKYFQLHERINCIIKPTLREKILYYLTNEVQRQANHTITIPFDREGLAGYLNSDRSALSRELSAMKQEGIIDYHKNSFKLFP